MIDPEWAAIVKAIPAATAYAELIVQPVGYLYYRNIWPVEQPIPPSILAGWVKRKAQLMRLALPAPTNDPGGGRDA